ncbi:MAG TPA: TetR/AcrR family transcriptional regulator [Solirubrobacteraceae bacterium]|nr:TetR/AcrR family transcriptional regulator [Solirubrobacteraceae bacterium]
MSAVTAGTRERLLRAAQELIEEGGYGAVSVLAIAERAGVAAGTLYRHWPSKGELFAELFRVVCDRELTAMEAAARSAPGSSPVEAIQAVLITFAERALRNPRLAWALIAEPVDPLVDAERIAYRREYARRLVDGLRAAIAGGEIPDQDVELTAAALVGGVGEALVGPLSLVAGPPAPPTGEITEALRAFVARAVGARSAP